MLIFNIKMLKYINIKQTKVFYTLHKGEKTNTSIILRDFEIILHNEKKIFDIYSRDEEMFV